MRRTELILVQPDGAVQRLVVVRSGGDETDQSSISSICDAMADHEFRKKLGSIDEVFAGRIKAVLDELQPKPDQQPAEG